jgi:hypothetical protein
VPREVFLRVADELVRASGRERTAYLMPGVEDTELRTYLERHTAHVGLYGAYPAYLVSSLKAWYGDAASPENGFGFDWLLAAVLDGRGGWLGVAGRAAGVAAGVLGVPLSGYTGLLLASTAMPGWNLGQPTLPPLFMAPGAATSGSLLRLAPLPPASRATVEALTLSAQAVELAAGAVHDRRVAARPRVRECYREARGWGAGRWLTAGSIVVAALPLGRHPAGRAAAAALGLAGSVLTKTAVFDAGIASAADPHVVR